MPSPAGFAWPLPRAVRAGVFAAVCVAFAVSAHLRAAEVVWTPAAAVVLPAAFGGAFGLTWILAGARLGTVGTAVWACTAQFVLHVCLGMVDGPSAASHGASHGVLHEASTQGGHASVSDGVIVAHLLAGVAFTLLLRHGESAVAVVSGFFGGTARAVLLLFRLPVPEAPELVHVGSRERRPTPRRLLVWSSPRVRRGPPFVES
ncbi:hypothetical protein [Thermomonospora umbrina]|uniref:Uncharacterized protein n=1 Tax=Thermomonospora umbrina TaxID=111806 RepID=A0A3D9SKP2_9ACTN|nr:hypothetical protein [Thermomonospora umbrina]REE96479.1 hypothetical protein DFJ69_1916 [Thermomonospora umbrina]